MSYAHLQAFVRGGLLMILLQRWRRLVMVLSFLLLVMVVREVVLPSPSNLSRVVCPCRFYR